MEPESERRSKGGVEIKRIPWNPVVTIVNVGVCIVPRPVYEFDGRNVVRNIDQHYAHADYFKLQSMGKNDSF